jgi:tRNA uridine 5-carboxymethylaminomethyl modification enzyme
MNQRHDVIVIGGGHAGTEAAALAARSGARTLLLTQNLDTIGQLSCNPAIGGIAKGTVVREVDALGGIMGRATDMARIQFRMLNRSKGPAVWSPRAQCDRGLYRRAVRVLLERLPTLALAQGTVGELRIGPTGVTGVRTVDGRCYNAGAVVLTAGTFLRGRIHVGMDPGIPAGRAGDAPSLELAQHLAGQGLNVERFKTGTPPRVDGRTVALERLDRQDGDPGPYWFSWYSRPEHPPQLPCYLTWTGTRLKEIIGRHLRESALYGGAISGKGPRYCPSIEDKVVKFPDAARHQVFLEPEGLDTSELYVNGLSSSLPPAVQLEFLRSVPGMEQVHMTRPGYAIEYDYYPPTQLHRTLEVRTIPRLFLAGQVNGTTGYEEAAGQGVVAGLNAAARALDRHPVTLGRDEAYLGVLIDDLVTRGVDEPYRLFTSRSEYRLLLRQDNALRRLYPLAERLGLLSDDERLIAERKLRREEDVLALCERTSIDPEAAAPILNPTTTPAPSERTKVSTLAARPGVPIHSLLAAVGIETDIADCEWPEIELKYGGYLARERRAALRFGQMEDFALPSSMDFRSLNTVSFEAREKLHVIRPTSLGQAGRIPGVSPSDLQSLVIAVLRRERSS